MMTFSTKYSRLAYALIVCVLTFASSCSTTRVLEEGEYRLKSNKVVIVGENHGIKATELESYIQQKANSKGLFGWNPFLCIYNWSDPSSNNGINKFWRKIGTAPVVFNRDLVLKSNGNIADHMEYLGYYNSKVTAKIDTVRKIAKATYYIHPGKTYPIDSISFSLPKGEFGKEFFIDSTNMLVRKGVNLSEKLLEEESTRSATYFRNLGYYNFSRNNYTFEADTLKGPTFLQYNIRSYARNSNSKIDGPLSKYVIGDVSITHSDQIRIKEDLLTKLCTVKPGLLYNEVMVNNTYNRLSSLRLFSSVGVELVPRDSAGIVDCKIRLGESKTKGFKINAEASANNSGLIGISPKISFYNKNIFHGGEWFSLGFSGNFQFMPKSDAKSTEFGFNASLSIPRFLGIPFSAFKGSNIPRTEFQISYNYQNRPEYSRQLTNLSYSYTGQFSKSIYFQVSPLRASYVNLSNISEEFLKTLISNRFLWDSYSSHIDAGLSATLYFTSCSDIVPKIPYRYCKLNFDSSGNIFSLFRNLMPQDQLGQRLVLGVPYSQYVKGEINLGKTFRFGNEDRQQLALRLCAGAGRAYGSSDAIPFEKQFYVGGASSMRGWQARALGPGFQNWEDYFSIPSQTGECKLELDTEYRFPIYWKLEGALFGECGNVWNFNEEYPHWIESLALDWGTGIRVNLDFILMRIDLGFKVYDPSREKDFRWIKPGDYFRNNGFAFHFGVGYPF